MGHQNCQFLSDIESGCRDEFVTISLTFGSYIASRLEKSILKSRGNWFDEKKFSTEVGFHTKVDRDHGTSKLPIFVRYRIWMPRWIRDNILDFWFIHRETIGEVYLKIPSQLIRWHWSNFDDIGRKNSSNRFAMYEPNVEDIITNRSNHLEPKTDMK